MKVELFLCHLSAVLLAALALCSMRYEFTEKPANRLEWALPPVLAVVVAAVLLIVSPGKRTELWTVAIYAGLAIGLGVGLILKVDQDFARKLVRVHRSWDGIIAAALLLLTALARFVSSDLIGANPRNTASLAAPRHFSQPTSAVGSSPCVTTKPGKRGTSTWSGAKSPNPSRRRRHVRFAN
jgi:hypothetical protein